MPLRPGWGQQGRSIKLRANFFAVKLPKGPLYEYDIKITPGITAKRMKRRLFELLDMDRAYAPHKGYLAHDSSAKMIAARMLPEPFTFEIMYFDEDQNGPQPGGKTYAIEITFIQELDLSTLSGLVSISP